MALLIIGLALFVGAHLLPTSQALRGALVARLGQNGYKALVAIASGVGLVLTVIGFGRAPEEQIFPPSQTARMLLPVAMAVAFVLMATAYAPGRLRRLLRHPMLAAVLIWSGLHFLANGDLAGNILFGTFAAWSAFAILSATRRGQKIGGPQTRAGADIIAVVLGLAAFAAILYLHETLFGVSPF